MAHLQQNAQQLPERYSLMSSTTIYTVDNFQGNSIFSFFTVYSQTQLRISPCYHIVVNRQYYFVEDKLMFCISKERNQGIRVKYTVALCPQPKPQFQPSQGCWSQAVLGFKASSWVRFRTTRSLPITPGQPALMH